MKIKRNTITALILGCVLSANIAMANTVDQSEISGTWTSDTATNGTVTAFSNTNLSYEKSVIVYDDSDDDSDDSTDDSSTVDAVVTFPLGDNENSIRDIDYSVVYETDDYGVITVYIVNDETGEYQEFWGFRSEVTTSTSTDDYGNTVTTYTYNGTSITQTELETYFFEKQENYLNIQGGIVDLNLTATASNGDDAIALDTSAMTDSEGNVVGITDEYTVEISSLSGYTEDQIVTLLGYMKIDATATSEGGSATAVYGDISHSYLTVEGSNGTLYFKEVNGDLNMNLTAQTKATYDSDTTSWSAGTTIGMEGNLTSELGNSYVTINAISYGATGDVSAVTDDTSTDDTSTDDTSTETYATTGFKGDISIGNGTVNISAASYDRVVNANDGSSDTSAAGDATAIDGTATFAGTTVSLVAYSESAAATGATDIIVTDGGNLSITATGATSAIGASIVTITDSTINSIVATSSEGSAVGVSTLTATDSDATISAIGETSATAVTTATLQGDSSLTATATSSTGTAIGVENLYLYNPTELTDTDDIDLKISAYSTTEAIGIVNLETVSSTNVDFDVTAQASGTSATTATAINSSIDSDIYGTISAYAESENGDATAIAIKGDIDGDIYGTITAYAESENGDATATAIEGDIDGDILGDVKAIAIGSTAYGISGNISADISGNVSASAYSTTDGDAATATAIDGTVTGDISGSVSATATAKVAGDSTTATATATAIDGEVTGTISGNITASADATASTDGTGTTATATATAIQTDGTSLTFDNATISATATATGDTTTTTATAISASGNLTTSGDATIYGDIYVSGTLTLDNSTLTQQGGSLTATSVNVSTESSNYTMSFDLNGELPVLTNTTINYSYIDTTNSTEVESAANGLITASAATLVGDTDTIDNSSIQFGGVDASTLIPTEGYDASGDGINYNISTDISGTTFTVTGTTYFEDKASTSNAATLGAALDAIELTTVDTAEMTADEINYAAREMKETVDSLNVDSFVPYANSFVSQVNAETYSNISLASVWRMRALMDKRVKTKRELAAEAIRNNPAFDGVDPDPTFKLEAKRVAQFQSVNMVASRDGGSAAPDYDYVSTGGTADIDFSINNNLLLGVGVGGVYNKIDGSNGSGDAESTSFILNMYAMYNLGDLDLFATLGYAHGFNESSKSSSIGNEEADWDSDSIFHLAGLSYSIDFKNGLILRPMAMYNLVYQKTGESTTTGGTYSTTVSGESYLNLKTYIGGEIIYTITKELELVARAFWTHEFGDNSYDYNYTSSLFNQYVGSVAYNGESADRDAFLIGLGLGYKFSEGIAAYLDYNANISSDFLGHNLNAALQMKF